MEIISITVSHSVDYLHQQFPCNYKPEIILFRLSLDAIEMITKYMNSLDARDD